MTNRLATARVCTVLARLFDAASRDDALEPPELPPGRASWSEVAAGERSEAFAGKYLPISAEAGKLFYAIVRAARPETVVEFGTSFGISTVFLAAAVEDNGTGHLVTTELSEKKAAAARVNLEEAGVAGAVTILEGDALETLAPVPGPVGFVLLDGWKNLCLPVLRLLEPKLSPGALIAGDDSTHAGMAEYLEYVRRSPTYVTVGFPVEDGVEISSWTGGAGQ